MPNKLFKKGLVVGIILLFIGIGFKPVLSNEVTIPAKSDSEEDCIECQSNGKTHLAEKLLNRLEKNEVISKVIKSNNLWDDDRPICILLNNTIQRLLDYADSLFYLMDTLPEDSILGEIISMIAYMIGWIGVGYVAAIAYKLNCWEITS